MTEYMRVPREPTPKMVRAGCAVTGVECFADCKSSDAAAIYRAMLAASPQGEGDCVCVRRGDGPEGCGLCNETGVATHPASPQGEGSSAEAHPPQPDALPGDLREKIAGIIVRKVLQEDYDDLVEGYLDEILMAADEIILLPAYQAVAQTYYDNLARAALTTGEATTPNAGERG